MTTVYSTKRPYDLVIVAIVKEWFVLSLAQEGAETRRLAAINQTQP